MKDSRRRSSSRILILVQEYVVHDMQDTVPKENVRRHDLRSGVPASHERARAIERSADLLARRTRRRGSALKVARVDASAVDDMIAKDRVKDARVRTCSSEVLLNCCERFVGGGKDSNAVSEVERVDEVGLGEGGAEGSEVVAVESCCELSRNIDDGVDHVDGKVLKSGGVHNGHFRAKSNKLYY